MKKSIFLFFAAILCSISAWAYNYGGSNVYYYFANTGNWPGANLYIWNGNWNTNWNMTKITNTNIYYHKWTSAYNNNEGILFRGAQNWNNGQTSDIKKSYTSHTSWVHNSTTGSTDLSNINRPAKVIAMLSTGGNYAQTANANCVATVSGYTVEKGNASATSKSASTSGSSANVSISAAYGSTITYTAKASTGYAFEGFSTTNSTSLPSTKYESGKTATASAYGSTDNSTYYAYFKATQYTITYNLNEGSGTMTPNTYTIETATFNLPTPTRAGYTFDGWYETSDFSGNQVTEITKGSTGNKNFYAKWTQNTTYSLAIVASAGIESVEGSTDPVTLGNTYPITATPAVGYKFSAWTAEPVANATFADATSASTDATVLNGSVTITASAEEIMSTLKTDNAYDKGTPSIALPTASVNEIGVTTTATVTAADHVDYKLASWTLTNCIRIDGGAEDASTITVKSNGDGEEATVIANYNIIPKITLYFVNSKNWSSVNCHHWETNTNGTTWPGDPMTKVDAVHGFDIYKISYTNLEHKYCIFNGGGNQTADLVAQDGQYYYLETNKWYATAEEIPAPDPLATEVYLAGEMNGWNTTASQFRKETTDGTTASVTVTLEAKTYKFKIIAGDWLGNKGTMTRGGDAVHEGGWTFEKLDGGDETNCKIVADIAGDYTFTWNLTTKQLTVTYPELPKYQVTATVNPAETGEVTGTGEYEQGETAALTATATEGYKFVNWTKAGEEVSTESTYSLIVTEAVKLVANFELKTYTVKFLNYDGEVLQSSTVNHGETPVYSGKTPERPADAQYTYTFSGWDNAIAAATGDQTYKAQFNTTVNQYTITVNTENGTVTGAGTYEHGAEVTLTATPVEGYHFEKWSNESTENPLTITVTKDVELQAIFAINVYDVTATAENGTVTGAGEYAHGTEVTLTATANDHYVFVNWTTGEEVVSTENPYMFTITADVDLVANFKLDTHTINATATNGTVTGAGTYNHGEEVTLTATPAEGYHFEKWSNESTENPLTITVTKDVELQAIFAINVYDVTATAENGTVTGAGEYAHGTEVTLTATPDFDYEFVKWSNESTENPLTITVTDNETLEAIFAEVAPTEVKESGVFSIGKNKTAVFATGNLQYKKEGENETWRFAKQQYQYVGEANINVGDDNYKGWIDMFGWSNGDVNKFGVNPSNKNEDYHGEFVDWGTKMGSEWSTLSKDQWDYLLFRRANYSTLKQIAMVDTILGIMLFPDEWTLLADCNPVVKRYTYTEEYPGQWADFEFDYNHYTLDQWTKMETAGAVFLPAAGRRTGGFGNKIDKDQQTVAEDYRHFNNANFFGYYWTSQMNKNNDKKEAYFVHNIQFMTGSEYAKVGQATYASEQGRYGQSVRLAKVTEKYEVTATAENGTVTGAGVYEAGTQVTLNATPAEGYEFVNWTAGKDTVSTEATYTFTVEADVELVANFALDSHTVTATATNGTVTGAGTYNHGEEVTLTATPAFDYEFEKWSNGSTDNPLTITVTDNETLEAIFAEVAATKKKESGVFSISAHKTATFATGNLQYHTGNKTWRFAKQQYQVVGEQNIQLGHPDFTGWIDMLGYSADGKYGVNPSNANADYAEEFVDWGTLFPEEGWSTLSKEDWKYLLEKRTNADKLQQVAKVGGILGIMLFPDNWTLPEDCNPTPEINHDPDDGEETKYDFTTQNYTLDQWTKLEQAGAVFLPAAGRRTGGWGNTTLSENVPGGVLDADGHYKHFDNCNEYAYYWTSTKVGENVNYLINCRLVDKPNDIYSVGAAHVDWAEKGRYGQSVRLAKVAYDKHEVTATAVNGTVTGLVEGGIYEHGATATLTATPAFDYQFVKWSNGSTDNPLTITVTDNEILEAIFAEVAATEKKESGVFSISAHKTATFATGNLQHNVGTGEWRFAKQQYQVVGEQNINLGDPSFSGWIDMLGWSNGEANNYGVNPSNVNELYDGEFVDWGTKMGEGWSTLSADEWKYLLNTRENAASLKQIAKVGDILGLLLFPDGWVMPEGVVVEAEKDEYFKVNIYNYTLEQWTQLEQAGAIFLPAAGRRAGGYGNMINYDQVEETDENNLNGGFYRHQDNTNIYCYYWTSTINAETKNVSYLHNVLALGKDEYTIGNGAIWGEKGRYGQSVRLAKVAYDKHEVTATAENGTVTGAGTYEHDATATLTATANEHYVFVNWTKGEEVVAETAEYTFTVEADVELVANFKLDSHTVAATAENGTVTGAGIYEHGKEVTLTATADEGYEFVNWTVGEEVVAETAEYTFTIKEDVNLVANFQEVVPVITHTVKWYTAVGETAEVTLEEGAAITKPETNPELEGYVFMGWTNECFVAEDGSDFAAIEDFGTADADKEYYAVFAKEMTTGGATNKTYSFDITKADFNTTSYAANNTTKTSKATASDGSTLDVQWTSNQVMLQTSAIQFKKNEGYIYNNTDLKNIISVEVTSTAGAFTTYYGTSGQPSSNTSVGSENGYFKIKVGSATGKCSNIKITFAHVISGEPTTTYSNYMTTCTPEEYTIEWSVNGEVTETTTVVEGDALVLPEAPAAPDACSDKVFMGWATTATVNTDGSAIRWVADTIIPESDNTYYAVFATEIIDAENSEIESVTLAYAGGTTANMTVDSNNAAIVGLNAEEWSVTAAKGGSNNAPGLNKDNDIRLYYSADGSNTITVSSLVENVTISNITITYTGENYSNSKVLVNDAVVTGTDGTYTINANSFVITNGNTSNVQVRIKSIVINYTKPSITYADYSTICVIPEYTVTFDYSVDAGYIIVNDKRISEKEVKYVEGTELTVKALTFNNYRFDAWEDEDGNELSTEPTYTFTVTADVVLKAVITYIPGAVGTGVENNNVVTSETMKVIQNGRLFIIREGKIYNAQGQVVK